MFDVKSILQSKTIWGLVISALPTVAGFFNLHIVPADATDAVSHVQAIIEQGMQFGGWALAFYGRMTATKTLAFFPK